MNFFKNYRTPFGYVADGNQVDAYGVDHSGFSTRDEVQYQFARQEREKQITENLNQQGIEPENYPPLGTAFWGNNPENNYGFGNSNISANIENRQNQTPLPNVGNINQGIGINHNSTISALSLIGTNSFLNASPYGKTMFSYNNSNKTSEQLNEQNQYINSALFPKSMANDNMSYKVAQNNLSNKTDASTGYYDEDFYRVFNKTLGEEGGYEDNPNKIDTATNMGFQQAALVRFKQKHPKLSQGFPDHVKNLTREQGKIIALKDYYEPYRIGEIKSPSIQETMFDSFFNHSPHAPALWAQKAINQNT